PGTATTASSVVPPTLPPSGGTAVGTLALVTASPLPSGTVVGTKLTETFTVGNDVQSEEPRPADYLAYRYPVPDPAPTQTQAEGEKLFATLPIVPSRTFESSELSSGHLHVDVFAGREAVRGTAGGNLGVTLDAGDARL